MAPPTEVSRAGATDRTVVLLAGPSGSGKSRVTRLAGVPWLNLDDYYRDASSPDLPRTRGLVDWDDVASWDAEAALAAITALCRTGAAEIPVYDIPSSRRVGRRRVELGSAPVFLAEGLFAPDLVPPCRAARIRFEALYLDRPRTLTFVLRLVRDLREHRKPPLVLLRRGLALWRAEPAMRTQALAAGCRPVSQRRALAFLRSAATGVG